MATIPNQRDYYEVLGVAKDADQSAIKDAFRNLALKYHPDRNKEPNAEERFKEIAEAYAVLSDPQKRKEYDSRGFSGVSGFSPEDLFAGINFEDIFGGFDFGISGFDPFEGLFRRRHAGPRRGADVEVELLIPLERVVSGGEEKLNLKRPSVCPACHGTGERDGAQRPKCKRCNGTGRVVQSSRQNAKDHVVIQHIATCPDCHGSGSISVHPCPICHGSGEIEHDEVVTVKIPVGIEEDTALRVPGKGMPSPDNGPTGDLYVVVRTRHDPRFERAGADLIRREAVSVTDAVLGSILEVETLEGTIKVTMPSGTQPGSMLRLKNKGLPTFMGGARGDMYVRIDVKIPQALNARERELYEELRKLGPERHR